MPTETPADTSAVQTTPADTAATAPTAAADTATPAAVASATVITEFPAAIAEGETFAFSYEGASYRATAKYPHVFFEASALADHLSRASRGLYDGLTVVA